MIANPGRSGTGLSSHISPTKEDISKFYTHDTIQLSFLREYLREARPTIPHEFMKVLCLKFEAILSASVCI